MWRCRRWRLTGKASHLVSTPALFFDTLGLAARTGSYPLEEINDYLRLHPSRSDQLAETLSYFDLRNFAPLVSASTLVMAGPASSVVGPEALGDLASSISGSAEVYASQQSSYKDGLFQEQMGRVEGWAMTNQ